MQIFNKKNTYWHLDLYIGECAEIQTSGKG